MPWIEYKCRQCGHEFKRLLLLGEKLPREKCPQCGDRDSEPMDSAKPLFEGIASFSSLGKDTN